MPQGSLFVASRTFASISVKFMTAASMVRAIGLFARAEHTILNFAHACLDIIQGQVADLIPQAVEVHAGRYCIIVLCEGVKKSNLNPTSAPLQSTV